MRSRMLIAGVVAGSLLVSGCATNPEGDDVGGALLIGAAVIGLGILAIGLSGDDDSSSSRHDRRGHGRDHDRYDRDHSRYTNNGRCDDAEYRTSNGGHAPSGSDERDCRRYGNGLK